MITIDSVVARMRTPCIRRILNQKFFGIRVYARTQANGQNDFVIYFYGSQPMSPISLSQTR